MKAVVVENYAHLAPIGRGWIEGLRGCGIDAQRCVAGHPVPDDAALVAYLDNPSSAHSIDTMVRREGVKTIVSLSYTPHFDIARAAETVDLFVSHTIKDAALDAMMSAHGRSVLHVPFGARADIFTPSRFPHDAIHDVAFIGSVWHGDRDMGIYLEPLLRVPGLRVYHSGRSAANCMPYRLTRTIYDLTKVCINFHYPNQRDSSRTELNARTFDLAHMGACQVIDHLPTGYEGLARQVDPDVWVDWIVALVDDQAERERQKALAAKTAVEHTWAKRMRVVLDALAKDGGR